MVAEGHYERGERDMKGYDKDSASEGLWRYWKAYISWRVGREMDGRWPGTKRPYRGKEDTSRQLGVSIKTGSIYNMYIKFR